MTPLLVVSVTLCPLLTALSSLSFLTGTQEVSSAPPTDPLNADLMSLLALSALEQGQ